MIRMLLLFIGLSIAYFMGFITCALLSANREDD